MIDWSVPVNNLRNGGEIARQAADRAMQSHRSSALTRMQTRTRIRTSALAASERVDVVNGEMIFRAGGGAVDYAWYQEAGTYKMSGTHYIEETVTEMAPIVFESVSAEIVSAFA